MESTGPSSGPPTPTPGTSGVDSIDPEMEVDMEFDMGVLANPLKTPEQTVEYWDKQLLVGNLSCHHFREWWRQRVPKLLSPTATMDYQSPLSHIDDDEVHRVLIAPLERFLCNGEPSQVLEKLSELNDPPAQCGKLFKMGEPTYSCRDCGHDPTCVLCVECFKNSEHKNHRYKMSTSCGGGYCDCGDSEAWSDFVHCSTHILGTELMNKDPLGKLPPEIQMRSRHVFTSVLKYAYDMLTTETVLQLPADLTFKDTEEPREVLHGLLHGQDTYCTVVYNDEVHTFDEVIKTLPRAVDCDSNAAIGFATLIDREGRALVKCSGFQVCSEVKGITERITSRRGGRPLRVMIMHSHVVAHQNFAMRLLQWLQHILTYSVGFRAMFSLLMLENDPKDPLLSHICRHDTTLWKQARSYLHHLLISGMLMENESKRQFASIFTKCYANMMKDFIQDDHDHSFSITSLSVQLFTVPTLAHYLIANEDVLSILLRTFMSECKHKRNARGKLEFQRNLNASGFRRSVFILYDLKYLLTTTPEPTAYDNNLRKGFLHGLSMLMEILSWMQGMEQQTRQTTHHVEYELEWEGAFNLHIKLAPVFSLVLNWCGSDRVVFIKALRMLFKRLHEDQKSETDTVHVTQEVAGHSAICVDYQVSVKPISLHLPLTRLLAGLSLNMGKFDLGWDAHELDITERPSMTEIMEPSLRTAVLIAQVQAGMWRRNGYSLVDQVRVYHDPRCRKEMLDLDVIMLQLSAATMDANEYLINLLNKFNLIAWSRREFDIAEDDSIRQITTLVEEFFGCLITILSERYTPGIGEITHEDAVRKEIVQLLCVEPMSHSQLNKALAEDINRETGMERVIDSVATFKKPTSSSTKGLYELKRENYGEYNHFFYHYTREEQSKAEEAQIARKKANNEPACNPPPMPPALTQSFARMLDVMQCDVFIYLMSIVLERADNLKTRCFSESQVHRVLHLIGLSLLEEERAKGSGFEFTKRAENLYGLMEQLVGSQRIESYKALLAWTMKKWQEVTGAPIPMDDGSQGADATADQTQESSTESDKKRRAEVAAARRARIMAQMKSAQKNFMKENATLFDETPSGLPKRNTSDVSIIDMDDDSKCVALGPHRSAPAVSETSFTCILCQEDEELSSDGKALVMASFVQKSSVLSKRRRAEDEGRISAAYQRFPLLSADLACSPHTSSCGHIMHAACWQKYFDDIVSHERQRSRMRHPQSFDVEKNEFLCPLCRCLSNSVMPLIPQFHVLQPLPMAGKAAAVHLDFSQWTQALLIALKYKKELTIEEQEENKDAKPDDPPATNVVTRYYTCPLDQVVTELDQMQHDSRSFTRLFTDNEGLELLFATEVFEMMNLFAHTTYRIGLDQLPHHHEERIPMMVWQSCAFTITATTWAIGEQGKPLFGSTNSRQNDCLSALVRFCGIVGSNFGEPKVIRSHALKMLSCLTEVDTSNLSVLEMDAFGVLVTLTFSLPSLFNGDQAAPLPSGNVQDQHIMHLVFVFHLVQILLTTDEFSTASEDEESVKDNSDKSAILDLLQAIRQTVGFASDSDGSEGLSAGGVWKDLKDASLPFLRSCAVFYHNLTNVPPPAELQDFPENEFDHLISYLGLPSSPRKLLESPYLLGLARKWSNHPNVHILLSSASSGPVTYPIKMNRLIQLPTDYSELINSISSFTCPKSLADDSRVPAMCLVCGEVLCSQSYCCQTTMDGMSVGACTAHAQTCGAGNGIFLRVRECKVILLSGKTKGCFIQPPYLDQYGETDTGLKRGNPLHLCRERYAKINRLWLSHGIAEEIAHNLESNQFLITTPWQHL